jgi:type IV pilus assembly protein PilX
MTMHTSPHRCRGRQQGVVLLFALIALGVMMIASVALVRSFNASLSGAGNIAFKRDLRNQGERAIQRVLDNFRGTGAFVDEAARQTTNVQLNYSAAAFVGTRVTPEGIPIDLLSRNKFGAAGDGTWRGEPITVSDQGVTIYYLVDRLCSQTGTPSTDRCQIAAGSEKGVSGSHQKTPDSTTGDTSGSSVALPVIYRISVRVDGPRDSQAFYQATFTL